MDKIISFKKELKLLLAKYNASIGFSVSEFSDTYGLYEEKIVVDFTPQDQPRSYNPPITLANGWEVMASDL